MTREPIEWTGRTWTRVADRRDEGSVTTDSAASFGSQRFALMQQARRIKPMCRGGRRQVSLVAPRRAHQPTVRVDHHFDLFHEAASYEYVDECWHVVGDARPHIFSVLTKRPQRMHEMLARYRLPKLPNLWIGVAVEHADHFHRLDDLRCLPAAVRFASFGPAFWPRAVVDLTNVDWVIFSGEGGSISRPSQPTWFEVICSLTSAPAAPLVPAILSTGRDGGRQVRTQSRSSVAMQPRGRHALQVTHDRLGHRRWPSA